jgi:glycosyltransferase involved in cell wall biosynthesis
MEKPVVSVIIPTRNRAPWLKRTLDSLLQDDYPNKEIIVCDGASTDGTVDLLQSYHKAVRWTSAKDGGEYQARNNGLRMSTGDLFRYISDDVLAVPGAFSFAVQYLEAHPEIDVLFGQTETWYAAYGGKPVLLPAIHFDQRALSLRNLIRQTVPVPPSETAFFRRRVLDHIGFFDPSYPGADNEYWVRAAKAGLRLSVADRLFTRGEMQYVWSTRKSLRTLMQQMHLAKRYGNWSDVLYVWSRRLLPGVARLAARDMLHLVGIYPTRAKMRRLSQPLNKEMNRG